MERQKNIVKEDGNGLSSTVTRIENYVQPSNKLDSSSSLSNLQKYKEEELDQVEKYIQDEESLSEEKIDQIDENASKTNTVDAKLNFQQLEGFTRNLDEGRKV